MEQDTDFTDTGRPTPEEDAVSLNTLSDEDLAYTANHSGYRAMLQDLLSPYIGENRASADHAGTSRDGRGTDTTRPESAQERERVETPDRRLSDIEERADNPASGILARFTHVLGKRKEGAVPPSAKRQRLGNSDHDPDGDTRSEAQSVEPQLFDPSLDREDKEEFRFEAPDRVGSYLEQHFRRTLSKEERTAIYAEKTSKTGCQGDDTTKAGSIHNRLCSEEGGQGKGCSLDENSR